MKIFRFFLGSVKIQLKGQEVPRFLGLCSKHHIRIWDIDPKDGDEITFVLLKPDVFRLHPLLKKTNSRFRILEKRGFPFWLRKYRWRYAFGLGFLLALGLFWYLSGFIWQVKLTGNSSVTDSMMEHFLEEQETGAGTRRKQIDTLALESAIRTAFPQVIWITVYQKGTVLHIDLREQMAVEEKTEEEAEEVYHLIAPCDGQVTSIFLRRGTAAVAVGDTVQQGDVLVYGWIPVYDDTGTLLQAYDSCRADGDVMIAGQEVYEEELPLSHAVRRWQEKSRRYFIIGTAYGSVDLMRYFLWESSHVIVTDTCELNLFGLLPLPLVLHQRQILFYDTQMQEYSRQEAEELLAAHFSDFCKKLEEKGIQITDKNVMIERRKTEYYMEGQVDCLYPAAGLVPGDLPSLE